MNLRPVKKLLLIFPPDRTMKDLMRTNVPPLGLMYLAAAVRDVCEVKILDAKAKGYHNERFVADSWVVFGLSMDEIKREIEAFKPDMVGINCLCSFNWPEAKEIAKLAKDISGDIITAIGGAHPTFLAEECLNEAGSIDFIFMGEGERTLKEFIICSQGDGNADGLTGIAFKSGDSVITNPKTTLIQDLDTLPLPARDLVDMESYFETAVPFSRTFKHRRNTTMISSRGCVAPCVFCSSVVFWGKTYRGREPEKVLDEIEHLIGKYGVREIQFIDDNLTFDMDRARKLFQGMIDRRLNISWNTPNGIAIWRLDEPMLELMKESGCYELTLAFESGDQKVMDEIVKKPLDLVKAKRLTKKMQDMGLLTHSFFIVGFPGETMEQINNTFNFAREMDLDSAYFFIANPLPGTELYKISKERGLLVEGFSFNNIEYSLSSIKSPEWDAEKLADIIRQQYFSYLIRTLVRHPVRTFRKHWAMFRSRPWQTLSRLKWALFPADREADT